MRGAAAAFGWALIRQHRWGATALLVYLFVLLVLRSVGEGARLSLEQPWLFALTFMMPFAASISYLLAVFSHGFAGDLAARHSLFPARSFALPVSTTSLVFWPMLFGTVAIALFTLVTRGLVLWPAGADVPVLWPPLAAAAVLAWTQALVWMPYPLGGLRIVVTTTWLAALGVLLVLALELDLPGDRLGLALAAQLPLAFAVARIAVARSRRGVGTGSAPSTAQVRRTRWIGRDPFTTPERAQAWFEWRRSGLTLPRMVAVLLPIVLSLLFVFRDAPELVAFTLIAGLLLPQILATFVAAAVGRASLVPGEAYQLMPFHATRPLSSLSLVAAKLKAAARSTLWTWAAVLLIVPIALVATGTLELVTDRWRALADILGAPRAVGATVLLVALLALATWKQLVQSLFIGLSGRAWLVKGRVFLTLTVLSFCLPVLSWLWSSRLFHWTVRHAGPLILVTLVALKMLFAFRVVAELQHRRLVPDRTLIRGALLWSSSTVALYLLLVWLGAELVFRRDILGLLSILLVPLVRVSAAPLALARNRHR